MAEVAPPPVAVPESTDINMSDANPPAESAEASTAEGEQVKQEGDAKQEGKEQEEEEEEDPNKIPDDACPTLYLQNLNEKVRIQVMKETLSNLFKPYRPLGPVTAHRNVRMRGQAFVSFPDKETANQARRDVHEFPLYGKPIQIKFARTLADAVVKKTGDEKAFEEHTKKRLEDKKLKRKNNPLRQKAQSKLKSTDPDSSAPSNPSAAKKQRIAQMPDEYLPPNSVLFVQNLPDGTTADDLREVFEVHPGLVEIRTIAAKKDIAFVEFGDEDSATVAKDALHNFKIDGETKMKVTYARK
ncbi:RNA binding protein [Cryptococcus wingfieldii CBS 7118]|uniref:RNA binding protein n=1 Tax=Cryptococcus wingfieldii CBS 7118 TaxID=1295528 RepID=A0A1E3IYD2_9TREE|nr:RNA binding protein [Cryptococcus wingfieldii CBS 7118]ODN93572.1 RNA binding protein [Cryptococcus wingfieldii CBS 7118]